MKIIGLVQARMGSSRLPGKVMRPLGGKPLVGQIFDRLAVVSGLQGVVLATTADPRNDPLVDYAEARGVPVYRETSENDLASRLAGAARAAAADAILKVNADCPMVDPAILQQLVVASNADPGVDYVSNKIEWTWPEGMSAEVIGTPALLWCDENLHGAEDRELVANWIRDHTERFRRLSITSTVNYHDSLPSLAVDTPEDYEAALRIFDALGGSQRIFGFSDILSFYENATRMEIG